MKNRLLGEALVKKARSKFGRLIIVTGARQTGKTTLVKEKFSHYKYISLEDPITRPQFTALSSLQWEKNYPKAILDEIQKAPTLVESIKAVYDQANEPQYILLGSSQILLLEKIRESLAGRVSIFELFPLTFPEILTSSWSEKIHESRLLRWMKEPTDLSIFDGMPLTEDRYIENNRILENYSRFGAMPVVVDNSLTTEEKDEWLYNYVLTYLQRDVRDLGNIRDLEPFVLAQRSVAQNTGNLLNYQNLANLSGISPKTAKRFVTYLELSYQVLVLRPWFRNVNKRLGKASKIHFLDPGVHRAIASRKDALTGNEFESAIIAEIYKQIKTSNLRINFYHLRTVDGREVDLILETEEGFVAIEIKKSNKIVSSDARHLRGIGEILDKPVIHSFILSHDSEIKQLDDKIMAMPAAWFLGSA